MKHPISYLRLPACLCLSRLENMPFAHFDLPLGMLAAILLTKHLSLPATYDAIFIEQLKESVKWLMGYPAGLKLNSDVTRFLGGMFLWLIDLWSWLVHELSWTIRPAMIFFSVLGGLSGMLCSLIDLWSALTAHLLFFHVIAARIFHWELYLMGSLFRLFQGKRRNPLRNRTDSAEYSLDQQLLGTVFFAFVLAILPTLTVYHLLFLLMRVTVIPLLLASHLLRWWGYTARTDRPKINHA